VLRVKDVKTKKGRRRNDLSPETLAALSLHRQAMLKEGDCRPEAPVFCDTRGGHLRISNLRQNSFHPVLEEAGLPPIALNGPPPYEREPVAPRGCPG
jgi:hypothetical protein